MIDSEIKQQIQLPPLRDVIREYELRAEKSTGAEFFTRTRTSLIRLCGYPVLWRE